LGQNGGSRTATLDTSVVKLSAASIFSRGHQCGIVVGLNDSHVEL
jgi:hypothetical protein